MKKFFRVTRPTFWGDCGAVLCAGLASRCPEDASGILRLQRTGPWVPSLTLPRNNVVVTSVFRKNLENDWPGMFEFGIVQKVHIVELRWEDYDLRACIPDGLQGEVEGHILYRKHSERASRQMGDLWEVRLRKGAQTKSHRDPEDGHWIIEIDIDTWDGSVFFRSSTQRHVIATTAFADWLLKHVGDWINLEEIEQSR